MIVVDDKVLRGARRIGAYLGIPPSAVRRLSDQRAIPTFTFPGENIICARVGSLTAYLSDLEARAAKAGDVAA